MAKLSAHGHEVARLSLTVTRPEGWTGDVYSFRSDGYILVNHKVSLSSGPHSYGWKIWKRFSDRAITAERVLAFAERMRDRYSERDWEFPDSELSVEFTKGVTL